MPQHANAANQNLHVDKAIKLAVRAASTATLTLTAPGSTIDGVTMVNGDRFLAKDQSAPAQNGIYIFNGAASTATRTSDAASASDFVHGFQVFVREGTLNAATYWYFTQTAALTIGTTALTFSRLIPVGTFTGEVTGTDFAPSGLTGSTAASRYVGATAGGSPTSGAHLLGDAVVDQLGGLWICTVAGTPGTFQQSGSVIQGGLNGQTIAIASLTELLTIAAAATSTTTMQIPAGAIVLGVPVRVTVAIPTAATFTVIGNTSTTAFNTAAVAVAANSTDKGTAAGAYYNATAQTIRITPNLTPGTNAGRVRVTILYLLVTPPTS